MNKNEFIKKCQEIGLNLNEEQIKKFDSYSEFLINYNKHTNLTAIKDIKGIYLKHFYDSIVIYKYKKFSNEKVLDIGSGAGFPGVPLKIVFPNIELYLLDSNNKKCEFLEKLRDYLNLDYNVIYDRAENYALNNSEKFDVVTGRAVKSMPILAELCIPFVKIGGEFISYKGDVDDSLENGKYAINYLGCQIKNIEKYFLPIENAKRSIVFSVKKESSPLGYPRVYDKIIKKPLQK